MIPTFLLEPAAWAALGPPLGNHLWQSTVCAAAAGLLTLLLRKNHARARHWLWLAASVKFLVPFSFLVSLGGQLEWRTGREVAPPLPAAIEQISQPFALPQMPAAATPAASAGPPAVPALLLVVWFLGCAVVLSFWCIRYRRIRAALRRASPMSIPAPIRVMSSPTRLEPGVFGVFRPVLLLPEGIADRLTPPQLEAILAHELCHARRRDNLAAAVHMLVEAIFWFHPLVWWIGARLVEERERACDEQVLLLGNEPEVYAAGILNVCRFYLESPLPCASGVTGSDLMKRIEAIMANRLLPRLTPARKILLASAGIAAVAGPIWIGIVNAPESRAQSTPGARAALSPEAELRFEVASIKPASPTVAGKAALELLPGGGLRVTNVTVKQLIGFAYDVQDHQVLGGPGWLGSERYDIVAKPEPEPGAIGTALPHGRAAENRVRQRTRSLLAERFQLAIHKGTREGPILALVMAKNGPKIRPSTQAEDIPPGTMRSQSQINARRGTMHMLATVLANWLRRPVVDRTGLTGNYDYTVKYAPETPGPAGAGAFGETLPESNPADITAPSIFSALQEQLGLKLEAAKGPVDFIEIDRAEKPSAN